MAELSGNGLVGRSVQFYKGDSTTGTLFIARTKTITLGSESIDVTSDTDDANPLIRPRPAADRHER